MARSKLDLSPREAKRIRTRARLTEAALRLMAERGIKATSVSEIAAEAELANGTFYLYFRDKSEIVAAVCQAVHLGHAQRHEQRPAVAGGWCGASGFRHPAIHRDRGSGAQLGRLLMWAFSEFEAIKEDISRYMRLDVALGIEQGCFTEPLDEFVIDTLLVILRAGIQSRLDGADAEVGARAAEYHLRILGLSPAEAHRVRLKADKAADRRSK